MASVLYVVNNTTQTVLANGTVLPGTVVHKNCNSQATLSGNAINVLGTGYFTIDVSATFTGAAAGEATLQLYKDGVAIPGAVGSQTITTADTEYRSISFTCEILKSCNCNSISTITLVNTGVGLTLSNVAIRVKRDA
jgi:hypothetical protein